MAHSNRKGGSNTSRLFTKKTHDEAVGELQKLLDKRTALRADEIMKAIANSNRYYEEILECITAAEEAV